jgi:hypothetical protein
VALEPVPKRPLAMQKVVGSNPISRFAKNPRSGGVLAWSDGPAVGPKNPSESPAGYNGSHEAGRGSRDYSYFLFFFLTFQSSVAGTPTLPASSIAWTWKVCLPFFTL